MKGIGKMASRRYWLLKLAGWIAKSALMSGSMALAY